MSGKRRTPGERSSVLVVVAQPPGPASQIEACLAASQHRRSTMGLVLLGPLMGLLGVDHDSVWDLFILRPTREAVAVAVLSPPSALSTQHSAVGVDRRGVVVGCAAGTRQPGYLPPCGMPTDGSSTASGFISCRGQERPRDTVHYTLHTPTRPAPHLAQRNTRDTRHERSALGLCPLLSALPRYSVLSAQLPSPPPLPS